MFETFRDYIVYLEKNGGLRRVKENVSPFLQVNRMAKASIEKGGPALLFENVEGHEMPIVAGLFGTCDRVFDLLDISKDDFPDAFNHKLGRLSSFPPVMVETGPVKDLILKGDDMELDMFPLTKHGKLDGGWYITAGVCVSKDPQSGVRNASFHRLKKQEEQRLGIWMAPFDLHRIVETYWAKDEPCPLAVVIGADPYVLLSACTSISSEEDEFALAGALKGNPIEMVSCETLPLEVPANAEIVLEGWIQPHDQLEEGPYTETSGYYSEPRLAPVITLSAITCRKEPIFHDIVTGAPPDENQAMLLTHQAQADKLAKSKFSESVLEVYLTPGGCTSFNAVVRIDKRFPGEAKQIGVYLLAVMPRLKNIWVVDKDIITDNPIHVEWAYATRCRGIRDIVIMGGMRSIPLDPCAVHGVVDKLVFDCTLPLPEERIEGEKSAIPCID